MLSINAFPKMKFPYAITIRSNYGGTKRLKVLWSWTAEHVLSVPFKNVNKSQIIFKEFVGLGWVGVVVHKRWGLEHKTVVIFSFPTSLLYWNCKGKHQEEDLFPPCMVSIRLFLLFFCFWNVGLNSVLLERLLQWRNTWVHTFFFI